MDVLEHLSSIVSKLVTELSSPYKIHTFPIFISQNTSNILQKRTH